MRRLITLLLIIPALAVGQSRFGHGGSGGVSVSSLLPIIADSTLWHLQGTDTLVTDGALPVKVSGLRVSGTTRLDGTLTMNTIATEQVKLGTGSDAAPELSSVGDPNTGIRMPGSDTVKVVGGGVEIARFYPVTSSPRLEMRFRTGTYSNGGRRTYFGADTLALFNGARTGRDSTVTILPNGYIGVNKVPTVALDVTGSITSSATITGSYITGTAGVTSYSYFNGATYSYATGINITADANNSGNDGLILFGRGQYSAPTTEYARFLHTGYLGIGTTTPAALLHVNNASILSKPLFRLGRDKLLNYPTGNDSLVFAVTGMGKVLISPNTGTYSAQPSDTLNLVNIIGKKSSDSLFVVHNDIVGRDSVFAILPNGNMASNGVVTIKRAVSLADAGEYTPQIPSGMCGWGSVQIGDDVEWARFRFKTDGTVTLEANSTNVGTTNDTDTKLNIYDAGTAGIVIENQLGSALTAAFVIECYLP